MYLADVSLPGDGSSGAFRLYAIGDMHCDRKAFTRKRFLRYRQQIIDDPGAVAIFAGDATEGRAPGMKHFDIGSLRPEFQLNMDSYYKMGLNTAAALLKPITDAGRPLIIVRGNHDSYCEGLGFSAMLAQLTGAQYLDAEGFVRIQSGREGKSYTTVVYANHGSGGGGRMGGSKVNDMEHSMRSFGCDVLLKAHLHDALLRILHRISINRKGPLRLVKRPVALYRAPAFLRRAVAGNVGYEGVKGMPTTDEGLMYLAVNPKASRMTRHECEF